MVLAWQCEILSTKNLQGQHHISLLRCEADLPVTPGLLSASGSEWLEGKWKESILSAFPLTLSKFLCLFFQSPYHQLKAEITFFHCEERHFLATVLYIEYTKRDAQAWLPGSGLRSERNATLLPRWKAMGIIICKLMYQDFWKLSAISPCPKISPRLINYSNNPAFFFCLCNSCFLPFST